MMDSHPDKKASFQDRSCKIATVTARLVYDLPIIIHKAWQKFALESVAVK
jgi:hypothetical protein